MMHRACTPTATPRDCRGNSKSAFVTAARSAKAMTFEGNDEPSLDELMGDDVMRRIMARDGVQPDQVWSLMDVMRNRLR